MSDGPVQSVKPLGFPWWTLDPFLFCAHHDDRYPSGNEAMGPGVSLAGRNMGMDFSRQDGWSMYHGEVIPGFPRHPHRGFETVTLARHGFIDHSDSLGAAARFGQGDVQWMTAGKGIVHSEMFPLINRDEGNRAELFQVWLNLPRRDKLVDPHFTMMWNSTIPRCTFHDEAGKATDVTVVAGRLGDLAGPPPPPSSWASRPDTDVAIWTIRMDANAEWTLPAAHGESSRVLYYFSGSGMTVAGVSLPEYHGAVVNAGEAIVLKSGATEAELLVLQGRPIAEPVARYGPFVMNTQGEIRQAMIDYQRTEYGGWPWQDDGPVHARDRGRFAVHADGSEENP